MYISGIESDGKRKLLWIPECPTGKGVDEFNTVKELLQNWGIGKEIIGMVFDTTASNSGEHSGACTYLEEWRGVPLLWLACRRHVIELHIAAAVKHIMGATKDPGMDLFRRLRDQWHELDLDYGNLTLFETAALPSDLNEKAETVLEWALQELHNQTFPR